MYYPDDVIEQVRSSNDIVDVVGSYVHLKKQGANYFGLCPFHNEKSPSFSVSPDKQIFYCFGCGAGGNVITFLMKYENYTFQEAMQALADRAGIKLPEADYSEEMKKKEEHRKMLFAVNKETATYYFKLLRSPKGATGLKYLTDRKLTSDTMNMFGLGYADGAGSDLVKHLRAMGFSDDVILEAGVAAHDERKGLHDKFWNRVMFPIMDVNNRVIGFGGRVMGDGKPKYLNSPETPIFDKGRNLYGLNLAKRSRKDQYILCEGYMDVIAMHQAGFTQAVASLGTSFTSGQAGILKKYVNGVLLSYDSDEAGVKAALRNNGILKEGGIRARVLDLRPYKDPDEFIKNAGAGEFQKRIDNAENSFYYELRMMEKDYNMTDPAGRTDFTREAARRLGTFEDEVERDNYISAVAEKYYINLDSLKKLVGSYTDTGVIKPVKRPMRSDTQGKTNENTATESEFRDQAWLLTWMSADKDVFAQVSRYIKPEDFSEGLPREVAEKFYADPEGNTIASIISLFTEEEEQNRAAKLFNAELVLPDEAQDREKALRDIVYSVKSHASKRITDEAGGGTDAFARMIKSRKELEELAKVRFHVRGTET